MSELTYYVIGEDNCRYEGMTREQTLAGIQQAIEQGEISDVDTGFVTKIKDINGGYIRFWIGSNAEYNKQVATLPPHTFCLITDDDLADQIVNKMDLIDAKIAELSSIVTATWTQDQSLIELEGLHVPTKVNIFYKRTGDTVAVRFNLAGDASGLNYSTGTNKSAVYLMPEGYKPTYSDDPYASAKQGVCIVGNTPTQTLKFEIAKDGWLYLLPNQIIEADEFQSILLMYEI